MLYNKGNHAQLKRVQPQPSRLQGENGGKIYSTWNPGKTKSFARLFRRKEVMSHKFHRYSPWFISEDFVCIAVE